MGIFLQNKFINEYCDTAGLGKCFENVSEYTERAGISGQQISILNEIFNTNYDGSEFCMGLTVCH